MRYFVVLLCLSGKKKNVVTLYNMAGISVAMQQKRFFFQNTAT
jgi:hypothetical protein